LKNTNKIRNFTLLDHFCLGIDQALRTISDNTGTTGREYPAKNEKEPELTSSERKHTAGLMRVNHAGEVSAQALYHGQALVSRSKEVKNKLNQSALEEGDHLNWCRIRLSELDSHSSYFNPLWYSGSFIIGLVAGAIGDRWSLGFLAETEAQVVKHLENHLQHLPCNDTKSQKILLQMQQDEAHHRDEAIHLGAATLPKPIKQLMDVVSKIMVKTAYWL
jgi:ubiquinone biosynthesis monooxygenase Coq7